MITPKNGLYLNSSDFMQWQDYVSPLINSNEKYNCGSNCGVCESTSCNSSSFKDINGKAKGLRLKNITFVVTECCNLACTYCYETHKTNNRMSKEVAKQAVDFIFNEEKINGYFELSKAQAVILEFIGGEPLLEIELIDYVVEYFKFKAFELDHPWATNYMISISTNGTTYKKDERVKRFLSRNPGKVSVGITIDGNKKLHDKCRVFHDGTGSYDIVEESVKLLVSTNSNPQTKITLCPENIMYTSEAIKNVWSIGMIGAFSNCVYEEGWKVEDAQIFYKELIKLADYLLENENYKKFFTSLFDPTIGKLSVSDQNWCGGNGDMLAIGTDGKCYPCIRYMKYTLNYQKEQPIGDIYVGLDKKEDNEWLNKLNQVTMSSQSPQKCLDCKISSGCSLCTAYNYDKHGDPNIRSTYICDTHKARVLANGYFYNKLRKIIPSVQPFEINLEKDLALTIIDSEEYEKLIVLSEWRV